MGTYMENARGGSKSHKWKVAGWLTTYSKKSTFFFDSYPLNSSSFVNVLVFHNRGVFRKVTADLVNFFYRIAYLTKKIFSKHTSTPPNRHSFHHIHRWIKFSALIYFILTSYRHIIVCQKRAYFTLPSCTYLTTITTSPHQTKFIWGRTDISTTHIWKVITIKKINLFKGRVLPIFTVKGYPQSQRAYHPPKSQGWPSDRQNSLWFSLNLSHWVHFWQGFWLWESDQSDQKHRPDLATDRPAPLSLQHQSTRPSIWIQSYSNILTKTT